MDPLATNAELATLPVMGQVTVCRRCNARPVCYPDSGLCHRCPALAVPTVLVPGSAEKIELMRDRDSAGLPIHVPGDLDPRALTRGDDDSRPYLVIRE